MTRTASARGGRRRSTIEEIRRAELVDAAIGIIDQVGFDRTTVREIANAADAAAGSVHYYFKTKGDLLRAAFVETERRFQARVRDELADLTGLEKLTKLIALCFPTDRELLPSWNVEIDLWQQAARQADFRALFDEVNRSWIQLIDETLQEAVSAGELASDLVTKQFALELATLIDGLTLYCRVTTRVDAELAARLLTSRIDGLRMPAAARAT